MLIVLLTLGTLQAADVNSRFSFRNRALQTALESCPNGVVDPGETNTVRLTLRKLVSGNFEEVKVEFVPGIGNVDFTVTPASLGTVSGDANTDFTADVRFRAGGKCGEVLRPVIRVSWKNGSTRDSDDFIMQRSADVTADNGNSERPFRMGAVVQSSYGFTNSAAIAINDFDLANDRLGRAGPYPSRITAAGVPNVKNPTQRVSGSSIFAADTGQFDGVGANNNIPVNERVRKAIVSLNNITHPFAQDLNIVLESPWGERYFLMKQAGGANPLNNVTLTFDTAASVGVPASSQIGSGTYRTADYNPAESLPDLSGTYQNNLDSAVRISSADVDAQNPNHSNGWKLFVQDDTIGGSGQIAGGWQITLVTERTVCCQALAGSSAPVITQVRNDEAGIAARRPGIANIEINEDQENAEVKFSVFDAVDETGSTDLSVAVTSGDQTLIENSQLVLDKISETTAMPISGSLNTLSSGDPFSGTTSLSESVNRKITIKKPVANRSGTVALTVTVTDGSGLSSTASFNVKINDVNDPPTIGQILGQAANIGQATLEVPFTVTDIESDASQLIPTVESDNTTLVPVANVFIRGSGGSRTVQVQPVAGQSGEATITIRFTDPQGGVGSRQFKVSFLTTAGDPTITPVLSPQTVDEDKTLTIPVIVRSNSGTAVSSITATALSSSNTGLIPLSSVSVSGAGTERNIIVTPLANQTGSADITIRVSDPGNNRQSQTTFTVVVNPVNDAPTITAISDQSINEDSNTSAIVFTVGDVDDAISNLSLIVSSFNTSLIPDTQVADATATAGYQVSSIGADGTVTIRVKPNANEFGRGVIRVRIEDDSVGDAKGRAERFFAVTVNPVNDAPTADYVEVVSGSANTDNVTQSGNIVQAGGSVNGVLGSDATTVTPTLIVKEDPNLNSDNGNPRPIAIRLAGISGGPGELTDQTSTVGIAVSVDRTDVITGLTLNRSSVTPANNTDVTSSSRSAEIRFRVTKEFDGEAVFTVRLTDNSGAQTERKFKLDLEPVNDAPVLGAIANRTVSKQATGITIPISLSDVETRTPLIQTTATADVANFLSTAVFDAANTTLTLVKGSAITAGSGNQSATITVTARDRGPLDTAYADGTTSTRTFTLTFSDNRPPTLTLVTPANGEITIPEDGVATQVMTFTDDKALDQITFSARSSNSGIVNAANNVLFNRNNTTGDLTVIIIPTADAAGSAEITITATDADQLDASAVVKLTVTQVDDSPTISVKKSGDSGTKWSGSTITSVEDANPVEDPKTASKLIEVDVADPETSADSLTVTATSANTTVIPNGNITISSTGSTRTVRIVPAANQNGAVAVTLRVQDSAGKIAEETITIDVVAVNDAPTMDALSDITVAEDSGARVITVSGITAGANEGSQTVTLEVRARDSGANDFTTSSSIVSGLGDTANVSGSQNVTITPVANAAGSTTLRFRLVDTGTSGSGNVNTTERTILFVVTPVNDAPEIRLAADFGSAETSEITVASGTSSVIVPIAIRDAEAPSQADLSALSVTAISSNPTLIPNTASNLELGGAGGSRGLIVKPAVGQFGVAQVTVTVTDRGQPNGENVLTASKTLTVRIDAGQSPVISALSDVTIQKNQDSPVISFTVNDAQTAPGSLTVTAAAENKTLVPDANIQLVNQGQTRLMAIRPGTDQSGSTRITVTVRDADNNSTTGSFILTVLGELPTISAIGNQVVAKNGSIGPLSFSINDRETFPGFLQVAATSSNPTFIPQANITLGGSGTSRTVTVRPATDAVGASEITITVTDLDGQSANTKFTVSTTDTNQAPSISAIANQTTGIGQTTSAISFTLSDDSSVDQLTVTATSSNTVLVPNSSIFISPSGATRSIILTPAAGQTGSTTVTITATDRGDVPKSATRSFTLTVSDNQAPTISSVANQTTDQNKATAAISFTVADAETAAGSLTVAGTSSNTTIVPNANIVIGGTGGSRTVVVTPANNQVGTVTITLTVTDGGGKTAQQSFSLTINATAPAKGDLDGDGKSDIVFQDADGFLAAWLMDGANLKQATFLLPSNIGDTNYRIAGTGDFNSDGQEDVLFQHTDGTLAIWLMSGVSQIDARLLSPSNPGDRNWRVVGTGDVNRDGKVDILFQHTDGTLAVWNMNGTTLTSAALLNPSHPGDRNWRVATVGDLDGDGRVDLVFQHNDGTLALWTMNGASLTQAALLSTSNAGAGWSVIGSADINRDGKTDLLFQHTDTSLAVWYMNGRTMTSASLLNPRSSGAGWRAVSPR